MLKMPNLSFRDTEELSASLSHANVRAMQIERGPFEARLLRRQVGEWSFQYLRFLRGASVCTGDAAFDRYLFLLPLDGARGSRLLGQDMSDDGVGVYPPGSEHGDVTRAGLSEVLLAPPQLLIVAAQERGDRIIMPKSGAEHRNLSPAKLNQLRQTLRGFEHSPVVGTQPDAVSRTVADLLTTSFVEAFSAIEDGGRSGRVPMPRGPILKRIAEEIERREGELLLASELAAVAGVSQPTLQRVFLEWYGLPPAKYLMLRRLYLARSKLCSGVHQSVSEVAEQCGFIDLSRFAKRYKAVFGELPYQTLRSRS